MAAGSTDSYFDKFVSANQEFPQAIQSFISFIHDFDIGKPSIDVIKQDLIELKLKREKFNMQKYLSKVDLFCASYDAKISHMNEVIFYYFNFTILNLVVGNSRG